MEEDQKIYLSLLSEIVAKHAIILGFDMAILRAKSIADISIDSNGVVIGVNGYMADSAKKLINAYTELTGSATKNVIDSIFSKYPQIKKID